MSDEQEPNTEWISPIGEAHAESAERRRAASPEYRQAREAREAAQALLDLADAFAWWTYGCLRWNPDRLPAERRSELEQADWAAQFELYHGLSPNCSLDDYERAQAKHEVDAHVARGAITTFADNETFLEWLESPERAEDPAASSFIVSDPDIFGGAPVIRGTRLLASAIARRIDAGDTFEMLQQERPDVPPQAFEAAYRYAKAHPQTDQPPKPWREQDD